MLTYMNGDVITYVGLYHPFTENSQVKSPKMAFYAYVLLLT